MAANCFTQSCKNPRLRVVEPFEAGRMEVKPPGVFLHLRAARPIGLASVGGGASLCGRSYDPDYPLDCLFFYLPGLT